jgi:hypothetical protein
MISKHVENDDSWRRETNERRQSPINPVVPVRLAQRVIQSGAIALGIDLRLALSVSPRL